MQRTVHDLGKTKYRTEKAKTDAPSAQKKARTDGSAAAAVSDGTMDTADDDDGSDTKVSLLGMLLDFLRNMRAGGGGGLDGGRSHSQASHMAWCREGSGKGDGGSNRPPYVSVLMVEQFVCRKSHSTVNACTSEKNDSLYNSYQDLWVSVF